MKNKSVTYGLLIVVAIIWYQVFFRVSGSLFGEDEAIAPPVNQVSVVPMAERDTFDLQANYRDPFGETKKKAVVVGDDVAPPRQRTPKPLPPQIVWPPIEYFGLVKKTHSKAPLAILKVDGIQLMLRRGEEMFNEIVLKEIGRDSIQIVYKREKRTFWRN